LVAVPVALDDERIVTCVAVEPGGSGTVGVWVAVAVSFIPVSRDSTVAVLTVVVVVDPPPAAPDVAADSTSCPLVIRWDTCVDCCALSVLTVSASTPVARLVSSAEVCVVP
jgi:hypothetical protein